LLSLAVGAIAWWDGAAGTLLLVASAAAYTGHLQLSDTYDQEPPP